MNLYIEVALNGIVRILKPCGLIITLTLCHNIEVFTIIAIDKKVLLSFI